MKKFKLLVVSCFFYYSTYNFFKIFQIQKILFNFIKKQIIRQYYKNYKFIKNDFCNFNKFILIFKFLYNLI